MRAIAAHTVRLGPRIARARANFASAATGDTSTTRRKEGGPKKAFFPTEGPPPAGDFSNITDAYKTKLVSSPLQALVFDERVLSTHALRAAPLSEREQARASTGVAAAMQKFVGFASIGGGRRQQLATALAEKRAAQHGGSAAASAAAAEVFSGGGRKWTTAKGAAGILQYLDVRSLARVLLPFGPRGAATDARLADLQEQIGVPFVHVADACDTKTGGGGSPAVLRKAVVDAARLADVPDIGAVMVVSAEHDVIAAAAAAGARTACVRRATPTKNWKAAQAAQHDVHRLVDLQLTVEELNGVSFRRSALR